MAYHRQKPNQSPIVAADLIMRWQMNKLSRGKWEREINRGRPFISHLITKSATSKGDWNGSWLCSLLFTYVHYSVPPYKMREDSCSKKKFPMLRYVGSRVFSIHIFLPYGPWQFQKRYMWLPRKLNCNIYLGNADLLYRRIEDYLDFDINMFTYKILLNQNICTIERILTSENCFYLGDHINTMILP